jgi:hypothetical protein
MRKIHVFVSFDVEHDRELYERLLAQSRVPRSGFEVVGASESATTAQAQSDRTRARIRKADQVLVICGEHTEASVGMGAELGIAQQEQTPYILLWGRREIMCTKPIGAQSLEGMYSWTRQILLDQMAFACRKAAADATAENLRAARLNG